MEEKILTNFDELGHDLAEFPDFFDLAEKAGLKNFADAYRVYSHSPLNGVTRLKWVLSRFILWLGLASVGKYKVLSGNNDGVDVYCTMTPFVSHIELYHQAQNLYKSALRFSIEPTV